MSDKKQDEPSGGIGAFGISFGVGSAPPKPGVGVIGAGKLDEAPHRAIARADDPVGETTRDVSTFRILVLSELHPRQGHALRTMPANVPIQFTKDNFDVALQQLGTDLSLEVPDPLFAGAPNLRLDLRFTGFRSFRPDGLLEACDLLKALVESKALIEGVDAGKVRSAEARTKMGASLPPMWADALGGDLGGEVAQPSSPKAAPVAAPARGKASAIDSLFDMVEVSGDVAAQAELPALVGTPNAAKDMVDAFARSTASPRATTSKGALAQIERLISVLLAAILDAPEFRRIEASVRSLKLLVDRVAKRTPIDGGDRLVEVDLFPTSFDSVDQAFRRLLAPSAEEADRAPVDLLVLDYDSEATSVSLDRLALVADLASTLQIPVVANGSPHMLGFDDLPSLARTQRRVSGSDDPRARAARALSARDETRLLMIALNRFLLRGPYTGSTGRVAGFKQSDETRHCLWGRPAFLVAILAGLSFHQTGWACSVTGPRHGIVEGLTTHTVEDSAIAVESFMAADAVNEAARAGFTVFSCGRNDDRAVLVKAPMLLRGEGAARIGEAPSLTTLGEQLFVTRVTKAIEMVAGVLPPDAPEKAAAEVATIALLDMFGSSHNRPTIRAHVAQGTLHVTVEPHGFHGVQIEEFAVAQRIG